jgi:hypothetical protein
MINKDRYDYRSWQRRYPEFDPEDYTHWIRKRGYYESALDPSKPEFDEYVTVYIHNHRGHNPHATS